MIRTFTIAIVVMTVLAQVQAQELDTLKVGVQPDGRIVVPTNQVLQPAGRQVEFPGRPVDLLPVEGGRVLVAKNLHSLVFIDAATGQVRQTLATPGTGPGSKPGLALSVWRRPATVSMRATP